MLPMTLAIKGESPGEWIYNNLRLEDNILHSSLLDGSYLSSEI